MFKRPLTLKVNEHSPARVWAKQNDTGRELEITLTDGTAALDLTGATITLSARKPDGKNVFISGIPAGNKAKVALTNQLLAVPGTVDAEINVYRGKERLSSARFELAIESSVQSDDAVESTDDFSAVTDVMGKLSNFEEVAVRADTAADKAQAAAALAGQVADGSVPDGIVSGTKLHAAIVNLLDLSACTDGVIDPVTGEITENPDFVVTAFMPCIPGERYHCPAGNRRRSAWYDKNGTLISKVVHGSLASPGVVTAPDNSASFRLSYGLTTYDGIKGWDAEHSMVVHGGESYPTEYIPFGSAVVSWIRGEIPNSSITDEKLSEGAVTPKKILNGVQNLLDLSACTSGVIDPGTGEITENPDFVATAPMPCIPGEIYYCPGGNRRRCVWLDEKNAAVKVELHGTYGKPGPITAPANAAYFRLSYGAAPYDGVAGWDAERSMVIFGGEEYPAEYIPFGSIIIPWAFAFPRSKSVGKEQLLQNAVITEHLINGAVTSDKMADIQENLLNLSDCVPGKLSEINGTIDEGAKDYFTSAFIALPARQRFTYPEGENRCICYYDSEKQFLSSDYRSGDSVLIATSAIPEGATFLRISWKISGFDVWNPMLLKGSTYTSKYIKPGIALKWLEKNPLSGKKLAVLGDSICALHKSYITAVGYQNNMDFDRQTHNQSVWGSPIARHHSATNPASFLERFSLLRDTTDYLIIHGGVNDCGINVPIGSLTAWDDFTGSLNEYTFIGALESLFRQAQTKYIGAKTIFVANYKLLNLPKLGDYMDAAKRVCNKYSVPVLDFYNSSGLNIGLPSVKEKYWSDDIHLNEWGHLQLVPAVTAFLNSCGTISASEIPKQAQNWKKEIGRAISIYAENEAPLEITAKVTATETPPAMGDKSASNPSTIAGLTALKVTVCGENLFDESVLARYAKSQTDNEYVFKITGLLAKNLTPDVEFLPGTRYTLWYIARQISGNPRLRIGYTDGTFAETKPSISTEYEIIKFTSAANKTIKYITSTYSSDGDDWNIQKNSVCLVKGATLASYIPYRGTTYNIALPSTAWGLPGHEDIIDLANRKLIHRTGYIASYNGEDVGGNYLSSTGGLGIGAKVVYALSAPIEESISNVPEIRALPFPDKYTAAKSTIMCKDGTLEVGHAVNTVAEINELRNSILSLGGVINV